jgi:hypothetical protein
MRWGQKEFSFYRWNSDFDVRTRTAETGSFGIYAGGPFRRLHQEGQNVPSELFGILQEREVALIGQDQQPGTWDRRRELLCMRPLDRFVVIDGHDQNRRSARGEPPTRVSTALPSPLLAELLAGLKHPRGPVSPTGRPGLPGAFDALPSDPGRCAIPE